MKAFLLPIIILFNSSSLFCMDAQISWQRLADDFNPNIEWVERGVKRDPCEWGLTVNDYDFYYEICKLGKMNRLAFCRYQKERTSITIKYFKNLHENGVLNSVVDPEFVNNLFITPLKTMLEERIELTPKRINRFNALQNQLWACFKLYVHEYEVAVYNILIKNYAEKKATIAANMRDWGAKEHLYQERIICQHAIEHLSFTRFFVGRLLRNTGIWRVDNIHFVHNEIRRPISQVECLQKAPSENGNLLLSWILQHKKISGALGICAFLYFVNALIPWGLIMAFVDFKQSA